MTCLDMTPLSSSEIRNGDMRIFFMNGGWKNENTVFHITVHYVTTLSGVVVVAINFFWHSDSLMDIEHSTRSLV